MKKPLFLSSSLLGGLIVCLAAAPALAQDATQPPPSAPPMASSGGSMGGGAIGIGAEAFLSGLTGAEFVYDMSMFHVEAILGYDHISNANNGGSSSDFTFGVAGWYHLARGSNADFSIGGSVGLIYQSFVGGGSSTGFAIEPGAEARIFLSPNFALNGRVGIAITTGDNMAPTTLSIGGQTTSGQATAATSAGFGFTYFFR
jgi:hypothetical protein